MIFAVKFQQLLCAPDTHFGKMRQKYSISGSFRLYPVTRYALWWHAMHFWKHGFTSLNIANTPDTEKAYLAFAIAAFIVFRYRIRFTFIRVATRGLFEFF